MLKETFPGWQFNAPATEKEIAAAESDLDLRLPEPLRRLYLISNGFRKPKGKSQYLLPLSDEDGGESLVATTLFMWSEYSKPDFGPYVFFGASGADEYWGINWRQPQEIIAYHPDMKGGFEHAGDDLLEVFKADNARHGG